MGRFSPPPFPTRKCGPSDRIYLKRWLELLHPDEFREGIDYSIMFDGGRLLAHVRLDRKEDNPDMEEADDLIHLLRINQHSAILIDSDRRSKDAPLNATKLRVQQECTTARIPCWITDGREIENYLPVEAVSAVYSELSTSPVKIALPKYRALEDTLKKALKKSWPRANYYSEAKPQMARRIAPKIHRQQLPPGLVEWLEKLVRVIRHKLN